MPKGLRHAFSVRPFQSNMPPHLVQSWLGHASLRTTGIYGDAIGPAERAFAARKSTSKFGAAAAVSNLSLILISEKSDDKRTRPHMAPSVPHHPGHITIVTGELSHITQHTSAPVPARPVASLASLRRIEPHAAEALPEFLGILRLGEAVHMKPFMVIHGMPSGAESQIITELVNLLVAAVLAKPSGQRDLMRPAAVNAGRRQVALPAHARTVA